MDDGGRPTVSCLYSFAMFFFFFFMIRRPPRSTLFPTRRSSDLPKDPRFASAAERPKHIGLILEMAERWFAARTFEDRKSTRLNSSHSSISYAVFCLKKKILNIVHTLRLIVYPLEICRAYLYTLL